MTFSFLEEIKGVCTFEQTMLNSDNKKNGNHAHKLVMVPVLSWVSFAQFSSSGFR